MAYDGITQIFNYMDQVTTQIVSENMSRIIGWAAPIAALGLTIQLTIDVLATLLRPSGEPLSHLVEKFVKYFAIVAIAGAGGLYATSLANAAINLPNELASVLLLKGSTGSNDSAIASMIDGAIDHSLTVTRTMFANSSIMSSTGIGFLSLHFSCYVNVVDLRHWGYINSAREIPPRRDALFGAGLHFVLDCPALGKFFGNWLGSVFNYIELIATTAMSFGVFMHFYDLAVAAASKPNADQAVISSIVTAGIITVMAVVLLKSLPDLAARWTGDVSTKLAQHLPQPKPGLSGGGGDSGGGSNSAGNSCSGSGSGPANSSSGGSGYSYARGSQGGSSSSTSGGRSSSSSSGSSTSSNASARGSQAAQSNP
ncbi:hypothetical protein BUMB_03611c [Candidatus Paraburkholderia calva]|nr:hypothetical protein BUMB_03611c [Candidatus Paraburkholderia calva]